jgi:hypothetical protein
VVDEHANDFILGHRRLSVHFPRQYVYHDPLTVVCAVPLGLLVAVRSALTSTLAELGWTIDALWEAERARPPARPGTLISLESPRLGRGKLVGLVLSDTGESGSAKIINRSMREDVLGVSGPLAQVKRGDVVGFRWNRTSAEPYAELDLHHFSGRS